jgi:hypothetical protein
MESRNGHTFSGTESGEVGASVAVFGDGGLDISKLV